jgi:CHAT domain-containing protein
MSAEQPAADAVSELGQCKDVISLQACLARRPDFVKPAIVEQLAEAVRQQVRVDVDEASRLAEAAFTIAGQLDDAASLGRGTRAKANACWYKGDFRAAVEFFQTAVGHFEHADMAEEIGRTLSGCIQPLALLGLYDQALEAAERARAIFQRIDDPWRLARLEINVANIHHRQDRFAEALASYERAYEQLLPHKDVEAMAVALHNIAVCLIILNDFDRALETYRRTREVCEKNGMPLLAAQADYNVAYLYFLRGDYDAAIQGLRTTRERCRQNGDAHHAALCDLDQSEIYIELNLAEEAERMALEAEHQFESLGMALEASRSVVNQAIARHQQNDSARALGLFAKAAGIFDREHNEAWQALIRLYSALVLFETGESVPATLLCREALSFFHSSGLDRRAILCHLLLARLAYASDLLPEAREHCEAALRKLATVEAPLLSCDAHVFLGHLQRAAGETSEGYRSYQHARLDLETLRSSLQGEELKIAFMKNRLAVYENLVEICLEDKRRAALEEAFGYMEQAKSRSLVELVFGRGNPRPWPEADGAAGERIRALRQELNWYYRRIEIEQTRPEGISIAQINSLREQTRIRENELLRVIREMPRKSDSKTVLQATGSVTLEQIRSAFGREATLLEYFQVGQYMVAAVVTDQELTMARLGPVSEIASSIRMLEFQLSKLRSKQFGRREFEQPLMAATQSRLEELYQNVLAPVAGVLKGRHLVVVPHGVLHYLPFHALWDGRRHLIDRFTISYAPSASIYAICHQRRANSSGDSLLLGVQDKRASWIRQEIQSVASVVPAPRVHMGRQATVEVLRTSGSSSRLIHIATHGMFRRDNPMFSSVRLGGSYLNMYDLYQLHLPVELLTLSGCGTGLSVVAAGDELLGLMRGLLSAGAQSLLLTLWDVHDRTTAEFMAAFYGCLQKYSDKAVAIREAMLDVRKRHSHPYYWAPFVLVGKAVASGE